MEKKTDAQEQAWFSKARLWTPQTSVRNHKLNQKDQLGMILHVWNTQTRLMGLPSLPTLGWLEKGKCTPFDSMHLRAVETVFRPVDQ